MLVFVLSCKKEDISFPGLPDATRTGANTAGCLLNGKAWVADKDYFWSTRAIYAQYGDNHSIGKDRRLILNLDRELSYDGSELEINERISITIKPLIKTGLQLISNFETAEFKFYAINKGQGTKIYELDNRVVPYLNISRLDTLNKVVSGTFDFRLKRAKDSNDTIRLSKGRFDAFYFPG